MSTRLSQHSSVHAVILAGGSGVRFWPLSREQMPKQMLSVFDEDSLLIAALDRAEKIVGSEGSIHIVVGEALLDELRNHVLSHARWRDRPIEYIVEPAARNTAPALALAAAVIAEKEADARLMMMPSDHLLKGDSEWVETANTALCAARDGSLVAIGLRPTAPATGFGYIQAEKTDCTCNNGHTVAAALPVKRFVEKPSQDVAERYIAEGSYFWNSGMLFARADAILAEIAVVHAAHPELSTAAENETLLKVVKALVDDPGSESVLADFRALSGESFDRAVLELSKKVQVVPAEFDWTDVGSLTALEILTQANNQGTRVIGQGLDIDSRNTLNYSPQRLVATLGLEDVIVVDTEDATLVAARDRIQDVRLVVDELQHRSAHEAIHSRISRRPWGNWTVLNRGLGYQVKEIEVFPGASLSLQKHQHRSEHWVVVEGRATVEIDGSSTVLEQGESSFIPAGMLHRLANNEDVALRVTEVAVGDYLGEDDIERFDDRYSRGEREGR